MINEKLQKCVKGLGRRKISTCDGPAGGVMETGINEKMRKRAGEQADTSLGDLRRSCRVGLSPCVCLPVCLSVCQSD